MKNPKKALGSYEIAKICHVTPPTINRWIKDGKLPFFTTGGGQCRVWIGDLVDFLNKHNIPVPPELKESDNLKILIVDDDAGMRDIAIRLIKRAYPEAEISEAADGFAAGHKVASFRPHLVILDIRLPGVDGYKICGLIREAPELKRTKILAVSGYELEISRKKSIETGADDFLGKPFENEEFIKKVSRLIGSPAK